MSELAVEPVVFATEDEWLKARACSLGGSDIPSLFGYGYKSALELWAEKRAAIWEPLSEQEWNPRYAAGHAMESVAATVAERDTGLHAVRPAKLLMFRTMNTHATPDAFALAEEPERVRLPTIHKRAEGVLSFKTASTAARSQWPDDAPTPYALIQIQHELALTGLPRGWVTVLFGLAEESKTYPVAFHRSFADAVAERVAKFWESIHADEPPAPAGTESDARAIRMLYGRSTDQAVVLDPSAAEIASRYIKCADLIREIEAKQSEAKQQLQLLLGENSLGIIPGYEKAVSWKTVVRHEKPREARDIEYRDFRLVKVPKEYES